MQKRLQVDHRPHEVTLTFDPVHPEAFRVAEGDRDIAGARAWRGARLELVIDGRTAEAYVTRGVGGRLEVWVAGERHVVEEDRRGATGGASAPAEDDVLAAPMPAKVVRVAVSVGDEVAEGQTLVVLESMKMELGVTSTRAGRVKSVTAVPGEIVPAGTILVELEKAAVVD